MKTDTVQERTTSNLDLRVEWVNGNGQWMILGGGLPRGAAWDGFDSREDALREARAIADDLSCEVLP